MTHAEYAGAILVVDDHHPTRMAVVALLSAAFPSCRVLTADSGEQALALCETAAPHLVVMDISLGSANGIDITRSITQRHPDTRVVMHSSNDQEIYRVASAAAGAAAFVAKSRTSRDLIPAIAALL